MKKILLLIFCFALVLPLVGCDWNKNEEHCEKCLPIVDVIGKDNISEIYMTQVFDSVRRSISAEKEKYLFDEILNGIFITNDEATVKEKKELLPSTTIYDITVSFCYDDGTCFSMFVFENGEVICIDQNNNEFVICGSGVIDFDLLNKM